MRTVILGKTGLEVSRIGMGGIPLNRPTARTRLLEWCSARSIWASPSSTQAGATGRARSALAKRLPGQAGPGAHCHKDLGAG
jgi:aryl-alcohol dehydrogenase-like predicted oxidoreductase